MDDLFNCLAILFCMDKTTWFVCHELGLSVCLLNESWLNVLDSHSELLWSELVDLLLLLAEWLKEMANEQRIGYRILRMILYLSLKAVNDNVGEADKDEMSKKGEKNPIYYHE